MFNAHPSSLLPDSAAKLYFLTPGLRWLDVCELNFSGGSGSTTVKFVIVGGVGLSGCYQSWDCHHASHLPLISSLPQSQISLYLCLSLFCPSLSFPLPLSFLAHFF